MGKTAHIDPGVKVHTYLPESLHTRLALALYSVVENRVPFGAYTEFFSARVREWLDWKRVDMAPYGLPQGYFITGPKEMVDEVIHRLINKGNQDALT